MSAARTVPATFFARHELRLILRDAAAMLSAGRTYRLPLVLAVALVVYGALHLLAHALLAPLLGGAAPGGKAALVVVSGLLAMMFSLMLSQAIEAVTRIYFGRGDFDLVLSSPTPVSRVFAVRAVIVALQTASLSILIASPAVNVAAWHGGASVLRAYPTLLCLGLVATALALVVATLLLGALGPARARLVAQIVAAIVGAGFVISLQVIAILGGSGLDRMAVLTSPALLAAAPNEASLVWWPAAAALGNAAALAAVVAGSVALFALCAAVAVRSLARDLRSIGSGVRGAGRRESFRGFSRKMGTVAALRGKEWLLLKRDPWLVSQSLQQVLYMLPPALLLFVSYGEDRSVLFVVVPVVVMAVGQLAGGLAWLTISGEDASELIETAPLVPRQVLAAKVSAVAGIVAWITVPLSLVLMPISPKAALSTLLGTTAAAAGATLIQLWFRSQANRSHFRRRQVSSRVATICEAMVSINCAAIACLFMAELPMILALGPLAALSVTIAVAWMAKPERAF